LEVALYDGVVRGDSCPQITQIGTDERRGILHHAIVSATPRTAQNSLGFELRRTGGTQLLWRLAFARSKGDGALLLVVQLIIGVGNRKSFPDHDLDFAAHFGRADSKRPPRGCAAQFCFRPAEQN
jgi:hypothetical protein